ncbi:hypothetical protein CYMTET_23613 [Cymbomonas tetramitiformis]|uniref:HELP domain-containing protein n=1 Tax=Cymbomonas tetramitiformis TaxID=36881 RepID=A0AAE0FXL8_9CHLO|nr:hypothetical protein CYMTET_23613 [Cymbomonas tetramitiformis]
MDLELFGMGADEPPRALRCHTFNGTEVTCADARPTDPLGIVNDIRPLGGLPGDGDPLERAAEEGYDSSLEAEANESYTRTERPAQGAVIRAGAGGRLSRAPSGGGSVYPCAESIFPPSGYETSALAGEIPENYLTLEFVHGYRGHDARHNLFYNAQGQMVFHAAAVGVVMDPSTRSQRFFQHHSDDIICLAIHPNHDIVATGQVGVDPVIHVWRTSDCALLASIRGFHKVGSLARFPRGLESSEQYGPDGLCASSKNTLDSSPMLGSHGAVFPRSDTCINPRLLRLYADRPLSRVAEVQCARVCNFWRPGKVPVGIGALSFNKDGTQLGTVGLDPRHSIALYDWETGADVAGGMCKGTLLASAPGGTKRIYCCAYSPFDGRFIAGGDQLLKFFTLEEGELFGTAAAYSHGARKGFAASTVLCLCFTPDGCTYAGTKGGCVYKYEEGGVKALKKYDGVHQGPVSELIFCNDYLISGGKDGKVHFHNTFMINRFTIDLSKVCESLVDDNCNALCYSAGRACYVRALCMGETSKKLAVGVATSAVFEFDVSSETSFKTGRELVLQGHAAAMDSVKKVMSGEVWGLDCHPTKGLYATCGDDRSLRLWSCSERKLLAIRKLKGRGRTVAFHPRGAQLAVGCVKGELLVLDIETSKLVASMSCGGRIHTCRYSPCGKLLAVAVGNVVKIYDSTKGVNGQYVKLEDCVGSTGDVLHLDWTKDSHYIMADTSTGELRAWEAADGDSAPFAHGSEAVDSEWHTSTCLTAWGAQGIWPEASNSIQDINACCRSHRGHWRDGDQVLAATDDFGGLRLFRYPVDVGRANFTEYHGHSAHVTNCSFTYNDKYLITVGGGDRCVFQWRHMEANEADEDTDEEDNHTYEEGKGNREVAMVQTGMVNGEAEYEPVAAADGYPNPNKNHSLAELKARRGYKSPMTGRPVMGQIHVPTGFEVDAKTTYEQSQETMRLDWVSGYRGWDARQNLFYTLGTQIAYPAAAFGVCYDPATNTQRFITDDPESDDVAEGNTDDILCMARHPNKTVFATGEIGRRPKIIVWDATNMQEMAQMAGFHRRAVLSMCFSPGDGNYLASVGKDNDHSVALYDWQKEELLTTFAGDQNPVLCVSWSPFDGTLVTTGVKHVKFCPELTSPSKPITKGARVKPKKGIISKKGKIQNFYTATFIARGKTVVGTRGGELYVFDGTQLMHAIKAHKVNVAMRAAK